jgi:hypothetical protein
MGKKSTKHNRRRTNKLTQKKQNSSLYNTLKYTSNWKRVVTFARKLSCHCVVVTRSAAESMGESAPMGSNSEETEQTNPAKVKIVEPMAGLQGTTLEH